MDNTELLAYLAEQIDWTETKTSEAYEEDDHGRANYFTGLRSGYSDVRSKLEAAG